MSRIAKQLLYGGGFLLIIFGVGFMVYTIGFAPAPSCYDNRQNQGEEAVDCGGPCGPCGIAQAQPLVTRNVSITKAGEGIGVAAEISNPNVNLGARSFEYTLRLIDDVGGVLAERNGTSYGYAGSVFYVVVPSLPFSIEQVARAEMSISNTVWDEQEDFSRPTFEVVESNTTKDNFVYVQGRVKNEESERYENVEVMALLYSNLGQLVGASKTTIAEVEPFGTESFSIPFPQELELYVPSFDVTQSFPRPLALDDTGQAVTNLQIFLAEVGLLVRDPSGFYDQATADAVTALQTQLGIEPTGAFTEETRQAVIALITGGVEQGVQGQEENRVDASKTKIFVRAR